MQENEIVTLLMGIAILIFVLTTHAEIKRVPSVKLLMGAFCALLAAWILTNVESFFWKETMNLAEHLCYGTGSVCFFAWCWKVFGSRGESRS